MPRPDSGQLSASTTTCRACHRMVRLMDVGGGERIATDPELIAVVRERIPGGAGVELGRRVHAERCAGYAADAERARTTAELQRFNRRAARRGRITGL